MFVCTLILLNIFRLSRNFSKVLKGKCAEFILRLQGHTKWFRFIMVYSDKSFFSAFYWFYNISNIIRLIYISEMSHTICFFFRSIEKVAFINRWQRITKKILLHCDVWGKIICVHFNDVMILQACWNHWSALQHDFY